MFFWFLKFFISLPLMILYPAKVIGRKNLPKKGGAIEICNHKRMFDPFFLALYQQRRPRFLAKKEIFKTFVMKGILKALGAVPIDRKTVNTTDMKRVVKILKKGKIMLIFPEGHRNKVDDGNMQQFKNGVSTFALMAKVPVIPMYMQKKVRMFRFNRIFVGEPIVFSEFYDTRPTPDVLEKTGLVITGKMNELKDFALNYKKSKIKAMPKNTLAH